MGRRRSLSRSSSGSIGRKRLDSESPPPPRRGRRSVSRGSYRLVSRPHLLNSQFTEPKIIRQSGHFSVFTFFKIFHAFSNSFFFAVDVELRHLRHHVVEVVRMTVDLRHVSVAAEAAVVAVMLVMQIVPKSRHHLDALVSLA